MWMFISKTNTAVCAPLHLREEESGLSIHEKHTQTPVALGIVGARNIFTAGLCLIALFRPTIPHWHTVLFTKETPLLLFWPTPRACGIRHCQSCTRSNLTCIPMTLSVLSPSSPVWLSILTRQSIITRPISPLIVQTMQASLLNLISPFYLLFTKNSLAGPCNYVVITAAEEKISQISFSLCQCAWSPTFPPHTGDIRVWNRVFF